MDIHYSKKIWFECHLQAQFIIHSDNQMEIGHIMKDGWLRQHPHICLPLFAIIHGTATKLIWSELFTHWHKTFFESVKSNTCQNIYCSKTFILIIKFDAALE